MKGLFIDFPNEFRNIRKIAQLLVSFKDTREIEDIFRNVPLAIVHRIRTLIIDHDLAKAEGLTSLTAKHLVEGVDSVLILRVSMLIQHLVPSLPITGFAGAVNVFWGLCH